MELYHYATINDKLLRNLEKREIYFNVVENVNDPFEGIFDFEVKKELQEQFIKVFYQHRYNEEIFKGFSFEEIKSEIIKFNVDHFLEKTGMSCYSEISNSLVMWGNYADGQKGICIGYDSEIGVFKHAEKVNYINEILKVTISNRDDLTMNYLREKIGVSLYTKYCDWQYEKEWRIISEAGSVVEYLPDAIKSIYFGCKTTQKDIDAVLNITKDNENIIYYKMKTNKNNYNLDFVVM